MHKKGHLCQVVLALLSSLLLHQDSIGAVPHLRNDEPDDLQTKPSTQALIDHQP